LSSAETELKQLRNAKDLNEDMSSKVALLEKQVSVFKREVDQVPLLKRANDDLQRRLDDARAANGESAAGTVSAITGVSSMAMKLRKENEDLKAKVRRESRMMMMNILDFVS
jgi:hypothetical protein